jgi:hypothetical protein
MTNAMRWLQHLNINRQLLGMAVRDCSKPAPHKFELCIREHLAGLEL